MAGELWTRLYQCPVRIQVSGITALTGFDSWAARFSGTETRTPAPGKEIEFVGSQKRSGWVPAGSTRDLTGMRPPQ